MYLPYLHTGGELFLNGVVFARISTSDAHYIVRWERPHLLHVPDSLLRDGVNVLDVRVARSASTSTMRFPRIAIGRDIDLRTPYEHRLFWVRTAPQITVATCILMSVCLFFIWWRRPAESLYGLLGVASLLWGARTLTFVIEYMPTDAWWFWRFIYHSATGGFVIALAAFYLRFAGLRAVGLQRVLLLYWLIGPLAMLADSSAMDATIGRIWAGGLLPIALGVLALAAYAAWKQRTWQAIVLCIAIVMGVLAGLHDYLLAWKESLLQAMAPQWTAHRFFLLHHTANGLLLVMAGILTSRFVQTLNDVEYLNTTLEHRVAQREHQLARNFEELSRLSRERAAEDERERIMRDMHDGLGSQLFTSLSRAERGALSQGDLLDTLRACISEMRVALDALAPTDDDFRATLGNFRYRWEAQLSASGIASTWTIHALSVASHQRLHILRILQEALTNALKHARATQVHVEAIRTDAGMRFEVRDNGCGHGAASTSGRGLDNMKARASRISAHLGINRRSRGYAHHVVRPRAASDELAGR